MHSDFWEPLVDIYSDIKMHQAVTGIILKHSTNKESILDATLKGLSFGDAATALDIGCGFGLFTHTLAGKLKPGTSVMGIDRCKGYRQPFLKTCKMAGFKGRFVSGGADYLKRISSNTFDLILCSFALYFFVDYIPEISRVLKPSGTFLIITHSCEHLRELFAFFKTEYKDYGSEIPECLPYEKLIRNFNDKNGKQLLNPYFKKISMKYYNSSLDFGACDFNDLELYFKFKQPFYLPGTMDKEKLIFYKIIESLRHHFSKGNTFRVTKDDIIFICLKPIVE